jgi:hypothetical protein
MIQEIVANVDDTTRETELTIHWSGGRHTELRLHRRRRGEHDNATPPKADEIVRRMAGQWPDNEIAGTLNRLGIKTGVGWAAGR